MFEEIDFSPGIITKNEFDVYEQTLLNEDNCLLTEDMLQIVYANKYVIDVGWYSGVKKFIIYVIKDCDWEVPLVKNTCAGIKELRENLLKYVKYVRTLL